VIIAGAAFQAMQSHSPTSTRAFRTERIATDLVVVGGGLAGVCAAITAARAGIDVALVQDRPVLGGNASSEVRLWILGATSHMGNNNRWAREGGVIDEILVENMHRNPEGNPVLVDALLIDKVAAEPRIRLLLDTAADEVERDPESGAIRAVRAFSPSNGTRYELSAPLFCDASGDGTIAFLAGAPFRMGAEPREEFGEGLAPPGGSTDMLGHSLYFMTRDTGRPVAFTRPAFAIDPVATIPRWRHFTPKHQGCQFWWIEHGGRLDTVHDTHAIKWELWQIVYGVWDHIKNSGRFPEAETLTLEWVGMIPGKRESRRFEGDVILTQQDLVERREWPDAVSYGGWAVDLHPPEGVYAAGDGCTQWHMEGVYQIPYRCLYSRTVPNLFLAGRIISASHVAFGSTRVMATGAHTAQAVGIAAAICRADNLVPRDLIEPSRMKLLQQMLLLRDQHIPGVPIEDAADLVRRGRLTASSRLQLAELQPSGSTRPLTESQALMLPVAAGPAPRVTIRLDVAKPTTLVASLRVSRRPDEHTPSVVLAEQRVTLSAGRAQDVPLDLHATFDTDRYGFWCLDVNPDVAVHTSDLRVSGVLTLFHRKNGSVAKSAVQSPPEGSGMHSFEFWTPERRPGGCNLAARIEPPLDRFGTGQLASGVNRPTSRPNAWVASPSDPRPAVTCSWDEPRVIERVELVFDTDRDHPMESVLMGHPERVGPYCVRNLVLRDETGRQLAQVHCNHQTRVSIRLDPPATISMLVVESEHPPAGAPAAIVDLRAYGPAVPAAS
jgi:hypothetical protein